ncbi:hypothetical protein KFK09_009178 [Dendrobium nobile]|uniref:Uncharacterized protein n=1 Tax=Dendrobium nobile TaxID=94219 RepID=A0A8T3BRK5_DENNO|nr:hypothetical protein KFK09_009178 [Dendrobium nobile]
MIFLENSCASSRYQQISSVATSGALILANNVLQSLPNTVASLRSLMILTLDGNKISILPDDLGSLYKLEQFSVSESNRSSAKDPTNTEINPWDALMDHAMLKSCRSQCKGSDGHRDQSVGCSHGSRQNEGMNLGKIFIRNFM